MPNRRTQPWYRKITVTIEKHRAKTRTNGEATLIAGADDDFDNLPVDIDLLRFREGGV
jgi:hypothetical protein